MSTNNRPLYIGLTILPGEYTTHYCENLQEAKELRDILLYERDFYRYIGSRD